MRLLVSACLLGAKCRYDGRDNRLDQAALLKERSPSCGCGRIYDGTFTKRLTEGNGLTAQRLMEEGLAIYGESRIDELPYR